MRKKTKKHWRIRSASTWPAACRILSEVLRHWQNRQWPSTIVFVRYLLQNASAARYITSEWNLKTSTCLFREWLSSGSWLAAGWTWPINTNTVEAWSCRWAVKNVAVRGLVRTRQADVSSVTPGQMATAAAVLVWQPPWRQALADSR